MVVLRAIGGFFARIGRWIKETAWIQPLLIVGAIFAVIFSIPHIIKGVSSWFDESDSANKFLTRYRLDLKDANVVPDGKYVGKDVFSDFLDISNLSTPYEEKFEEYEITHVMTYRNSKLNTLLEKDSNYSLIYGDDYFKIYEREI